MKRNMIPNAIVWGMGILTVIVLSGCMGSGRQQTGMTGKAAAIEEPQRPGLPELPPMTPLFPQSKPEEGSLWSDQAANLYDDTMARKVGDTVIVDIVENATSSLDANTKVERSSGIGADMPNLLGYMRAIEAQRPNINRNAGSPLSKRDGKLLSAKTTNNFEGKGTSDRQGQISASVGARVVAVLPNGNLSIYGRRELQVNREKQLIEVSGILRPQDISATNRIQSVYLADAKIVYSGNGPIADKQQPGWLARIVDTVWPF
ncbi:MAG: flagellin biosynthesis protein FlgH [Deltaproteobacteria bacterium]|nr:MAG: flagellin biosynthesis protein FlgH [Deltaproteobacteria bacterium]